MEGFWRFNSATEHFLNWMCAADMASVLELLGPHAYALARYGVSPQDDVETAVEEAGGQGAASGEASEGGGYLLRAVKTFFKAAAVSAASCSVRLGITRRVTTRSAAHSALGRGLYSVLRP
jgi:hypothetical protein